MPEPPRIVPLYIARVADLRYGRLVVVRCRSCGHIAELPVVTLRAKLPPYQFVRHLGAQFRCQRCNHRGADVDATRALGYYG